MTFVACDAHEGLVSAIKESFPGAMWRQCQTHFMRRALDFVRHADKGAAYGGLRMAIPAGSRE